ncbi:MAG: hypothetical protein IJ555_10420 [Ruminococcus sp.]|nr:hypothetical protein [Ruminococcus sp.]
MFEQEAGRLASVLKPSMTEGLTLKLMSGKVRSIGENNSTAVVDIGECCINALNKSGEQLTAGEYVWLCYTLSVADAVIWFKTGSSIPGNGEANE